MRTGDDRRRLRRRETPVYEGLNRRRHEGLNRRRHEGLYDHRMSEKLLSAKKRLAWAKKRLAWKELLLSWKERLSWKELLPWKLLPRKELRSWEKLSPCMEGDHRRSGHHNSWIRGSDPTRMLRFGQRRMHDRERAEDGNQKLYDFHRSSS
jgi:hypothetical protein